MYLVVFTSNPTLTTGGTYTRNGAGIKVSRKFGFGVLDTEAMVSRARHWINVPSQLEERVRHPAVGYVLAYNSVIEYVYSVCAQPNLLIILDGISL